MICVGPTMNRACKSVCLTFLSIYAIYTMVVLNIGLPELQTHSPHLFFMRIVTATVVCTLLTICLLLWYFSTSSSQDTVFVLAMMATGVMVTSELLELFGFTPTTDSNNGPHISLIRNGEWMVVIPLLLCMFGHACKIEERYVLISALLGFLSCFFFLLGSICSGKIVSALLMFVSGSLYFPVVVVVYVLCFRLNHLFAPSQLRVMRAFATSMVFAFALFTGFYLSTVSGCLPVGVEGFLFITFDAFDIISLLTMIFCFQFKNDATSNEIKLVHLEKANSAQKLFLRFIFHEVRVPFHSLLLGLEFLANELEREQHKDVVDTLIQSAEMMERTINDVLLLSRLEDGKLELEAAPFSVEEMVVSTVNSFKHMSAQQDVKLETEVDSALPLSLMGDRHRVSQILANLVSNAIKFSRKGHTVLVCIQAIDHSRTYCYLEMRVKDEGIGMSPEDQKLLFMPFSQIRPHQNQQGRGSGLGLSIVKHIVELLEGTLRVVSEVGKGSTFIVALKLPVCHATNDSVHLQSQRPSRYGTNKSTNTNRSNKRALASPKHDTELGFDEREHISASLSLKQSPKSNSRRRRSVSLTAGLRGRSMSEFFPRGRKSSTDKATAFSDFSPGCGNNREKAARTNSSSSKEILLQKDMTLIPMKPASSPKITPTCDSSLDTSLNRTCGSPLAKENALPPKKRRGVPTVLCPASISKESANLVESCGGMSSSGSVGATAKSTEPALVAEQKEKRVALVVDDSQMNRKFTRLTMEQQGFAVEEAFNGQEAVDMGGRRTMHLF